MKVLITGGTGFLGRTTVRALVAAGHDVRLIVRDRAKAEAAFNGLPVTVLEGDLTDPRSVDAAMLGCDAVVHAAATYTYDRAGSASMSANAVVARTVLEAGLRAEVHRVVDVASTAVFSLIPRRIDAETPLTRPGEPGWTDPYLRSKVEGEEVGRELEARGSPRVTVYPALIIGPDDAGPGPSGGVIISVLKGSPMPSIRSPWVDVRDVARAIVGALDAPVGSRYLLAEGVHAYREIGGVLSTVTGRRIRGLFLPGSGLRVISRINDAAGGRLGPYLRAGSLEFLLRSAPIVDAAAVTTELGLAYTPFEKTLTDSVRWWVANGTIDRRLAGRLA